ncbi:hypothetical protein L9F63_014403, partial [Diploptera punctata]
NTSTTYEIESKLNKLSVLIQNSNKKDVKYATNMTRLLLSSTLCELESYGIKIEELYSY